MRLFLLLFCALLILSCTKKSESGPNSEDLDSKSTLSDPSTLGTSETELVGKELKIEKPLYSKVLREALYFSASLEREAIKLLLKDNTIQKKSLFSVLSYIFETKSGTRKPTPLGLDCAQYDIKKEISYLSVLKTCFKPAKEIARLYIKAEDRDYEIKFLVSEWGAVLGLSAVLTGSDIKCKIKIVEQKLNVLECENWALQVTEDQLSATIIKLDQFLFQRNALQQFVMKGGFYKELVQNKKIDIKVPLEGKIKIIERELKVIDDFIDHKDGVVDGQNKIEIKPVEKKQENNEKNNQEEIKQESQSGEVQQEAGAQIQPETQSESQSQNQQEPQVEVTTEGQSSTIQTQPEVSEGNPNESNQNGGQGGRRGR